MKKWLDEWFAAKREDFYWRGIHKLPERWEKCVTSNGAYFEKVFKFLFIILPNLTCFFWEKNRHFILVHLVYSVRNDNVIDIEAILDDVGMTLGCRDLFVILSTTLRT